VDSLRGRYFTIRLAGDLSLRDGLAYFIEDQEEPVAFSVGLIRRAGREVPFARAGETVTVEVPLEAGPAMPRQGQEMRQLSSRFLDLPQPREPGFPLYKVPIDLDISMTREGMLCIQVEGCPLFQSRVTVDLAARCRPFVQILSSLLEESGDSLFRPGKISFHNASGFADDGIFVPPSELKRAKNDFYFFLGREFSFEQQAAAAPTAPQWAPPPPSPLRQEDLVKLAHRELLVPQSMSPVPFVGNDPLSLTVPQLPDQAGFRWLPIPPVIAGEEQWCSALRRLLECNPEVRFALGLNNLSHVELARSLAGIPNAWFFADFFLYIANRSAVSLLKRLVRPLLFAYEWLEEGHEGPSLNDAVPVVRISGDFKPPLFYSFGCFARHVLKNGQCYDTCPKDFENELRQGSNRFKVVVRDCVTYLFAADARG
jgi:hypothetical protein